MGNISWTTAVRASKVCVVLWLEPCHMFPKFGVWTRNGVEMPKVRKTVKFDLHYFWNYNSWGIQSLCGTLSWT